MSNSQIGLENRFKYLVEQFGYVVILFAKGNATLVPSFMGDLQHLKTNIKSRYTITKDEDKKDELHSLYEVAETLSNVADSIFTKQPYLSTASDPLPISNLKMKKHAPVINNPITGEEPKFVPTQYGGRKNKHIRG